MAEEDRKYLCIGGGHAAGDALTCSIGEYIGVAYLKEGARFNPAVVKAVHQAVLTKDKKTGETSVTKPAYLDVDLYPCGNGTVQGMRLVGTETRSGAFGWERILCHDKRSGLNCLLYVMNEKEIGSTRARIDKMTKTKTAVPTEEPVTVAVTLSPRDIAIRMLSVMSKDTPMGGKKIARLAELEYTEILIPILQKLREAGKVRRVTVGDVKRWLLA